MQISKGLDLFVHVVSGTLRGLVDALENSASALIGGCVVPEAELAEILINEGAGLDAHGLLLRLWDLIFGCLCAFLWAYIDSGLL